MGVSVKLTCLNFLSVSLGLLLYCPLPPPLSGEGSCFIL